MKHQPSLLTLKGVKPNSARENSTRFYFIKDTQQNMKRLKVNKKTNARAKNTNFIIEIALI